MKYGVGWVRHVCVWWFSSTNRDTTTIVALTSLGGRLAALSNLSIQAPSLSFHHHHPSSLYRSLTSPPFPRQACTIISQCLSHPQSLCLSLITDIDVSSSLEMSLLSCHSSVVWHTHKQAHIHTHHNTALSCGQGICYLRQSCRVNVSTSFSFIISAGNWWEKACCTSSIILVPTFFSKTSYLIF